MLCFVPDLSWGLSSPLCRQEARGYCPLLVCAPLLLKTSSGWIKPVSMCVPFFIKILRKGEEENYSIWGFGDIIESCFVRRFTAKKISSTLWPWNFGRLLSWSLRWGLSIQNPGSRASLSLLSSRTVSGCEAYRSNWEGKGFSGPELVQAQEALIPASWGTIIDRWLSFKGKPGTLSFRIHPWSPMLAGGSSLGSLIPGLLSVPALITLCC